MVAHYLERARLIRSSRRRQCHTRVGHSNNHHNHDGDDHADGDQHSNGNHTTVNINNVVPSLHTMVKDEEIVDQTILTSTGINMSSSLPLSLPSSADTRPNPVSLNSKATEVTSTVVLPLTSSSGDSTTIKMDERITAVEVGDDEFITSHELQSLSWPIRESCRYHYDTNIGACSHDMIVKSEGIVNVYDYGYGGNKTPVSPMTITDGDQSSVTSSESSIADEFLNLKDDVMSIIWCLLTLHQNESLILSVWRHCVVG
jgi:hypothetical protein